MPTSTIGRLRLVGRLEGASFIVLLGVAMPLKYLAGMPLAVRIVGMIHGLLFVALIVVLFQTWSERDWPWTRAAGVLLASLLPFGPFVIDRRLAREEEQDP